MSAPWETREEVIRKLERVRSGAARLRITPEEYMDRLSKAGMQLARWLKALEALGYKAGDNPVAFLHKLNESKS